LQKGHQILVNEFSIGSYKDKFICDVMPMDVCHISFGRPLKYDKKAIDNGRSNTYTFGKDGEKHVLFPLKNEKNTRRRPIQGNVT